MVIEMNQSQKDKYCMFSIYMKQLFRVVKIQTEKVELWLSGAGREGNGDLLFNGHGVSAQEDEEINEMDDGDGRTKIRIC